MNKWDKVRLGDICEKIGSGATPKGGKEAYCTSGISLIRSQNVLDYDFSSDGLAYINSEQAKKLNNVCVKQDDILLNITGDSVARVCKVDSRFIPARVNQHVAIIRGKRGMVLNSYILYFLQMIKPNLLMLSFGGATRKALTKQMIEDLPICLPDIDEQNKIVRLLDEIQDKIATNTSINKNLEEQAQTIYKSWFVDFEPFGGEMPMDWRMGIAGEILEFHDAKRVPLSGSEREKMDKIYPYYGATSLMDYVDNYIFEGIYLLLGEDGTVITNDGFPVLQYVDGKFWVNNHAHILTGKLGFSVEELYLLFSLTNIKSIVTGAVQPKVSQMNLKKISVVIPSKELLKEFDDIIQPMFADIRNRRSESQRLVALRDTLLPRLMSGEIDVSSIEL